MNEQSEKVILTIDDVIEDIKNAERTENEVYGLTAREMAEMLGFGEKKMAKILKRAVRSGKLKAKTQSIIDVAGRKNHTVVYFPNEANRD